MSEQAERYRRIAAVFTERVTAVPDGAWDNPTPCEGWVARDIVRHLVDWMPGLFLVAAGLDAPACPPADDHPVAAWRALDAALQGALDDPAVASIEYESQTGRHTVAEAIDRFGTPDVFLHTWDLARATGQDETLDPDEVHRLLEEIVPYDEALRASGHYGPRVAVPDDADEQTKLLAFIGRTP